MLLSAAGHFLSYCIVMQEVESNDELNLTGQPIQNFVPTSVILTSLGAGMQGASVPVAVQ